MPTYKAASIPKRSNLGFFGQLEAVDIHLLIMILFVMLDGTKPARGPIRERKEGQKWLREKWQSRNPKNTPLLYAGRHLPPTEMDKAGARRPKLVVLLLTARDASR